MRNELDQISRRSIVKGGAAALTALGSSPAVPLSFLPVNAHASSVDERGDMKMNTVRSKDEAEIYYRDWCFGQRIVFATVGPCRPKRGRDAGATGVSGHRA